MPRYKPNEVFRRRFIIVKYIAEGLSGDVYKARDQSGALVALKTFDPKLNKGSETVASYFSNEPVLLRAIKEERGHPHIVEYVAHAMDQQPYLATSFIDSDSPNGLEDLLGRSLPPGFTLRVVEQIGSALDYLHFGHKYFSPIIHRDVKPRNILIDRSGNAVLIDLSIAAYQAHKVARPHRIATWRYSAPEQHSGVEVPATDQFALAMIAFQMITGDALLTRNRTESQTDTLQKLNDMFHSDYASLRDKLRNKPHTSKVLIKALQYEPAYRYSSCEEFAVSLRQALLRDKADLRQTTPPRRLRVTKASLALGALIALALLFFMVALYLKGTVGVTLAPLASGVLLLR